MENQELLLALEEMERLVKKAHTMCAKLEQSETEKFEFPENNYTVLAVWLLHDPKAKRMFPIYQKKSWSELAERLTEYVGWVVTAYVLRQTVNRWEHKKGRK